VHFDCWSGRQTAEGPIEESQDDGWEIATLICDRYGSRQGTIRPSVIAYPSTLRLIQAMSIGHLLFPWRRRRS
jgi:hypothetical protein